MSVGLILPGTMASAADAVGESADANANTIVVTAQKERGAAVGDIPPLVSLTTGDIQALGASTVAEMIGLLSAQTRSGQGRGGEAPVILLGGRRISGFAEVRDLPPEAVARVEILPEEVALKYGYAATQRVVNIVLVDNFNAITGELEPRFATGTKRNDFNTEFALIKIKDGGRFTLDLQRQTAESLTEARRGLMGTEATHRTLIPETQQFTANAVFSRAAFASTMVTVNGRLDIADSLAGIGIAGATPLQQRSRIITSRAGLTLGGDAAGWRWSFTTGYDRIDGRTLTDTSAPTVDVGQSLATTASANFTANGALFSLPGGNVSASVSVDAQTIRLNSRTRRVGATVVGRAARDIGDARVNVDIPIASRRQGFLAALGELSVNANYLHQKLSDFGTLTTRGIGAHWEPVKPLSFLVSLTDEDGAPTPQQLAAPIISTPNVRFFDYVRGETATAARLDGGNRTLGGDTRHVFKAELSLKPLKETDLSLTTTYVRSRIDNPTAAFPAITARVEAAFPGRVERDATGRLLRVDARPVNFASTERSELRWGLSYGRGLGRDRGPSTPRVPGGGAFGGGHSFGATGSRVQVSLFHTIHLSDRLTIRNGITPLDLLNGDAIGNRGGQPPHEIDLSGNATRNGFGLRFSANWQSATTVNSPDGVPAKVLHFGAIGTLNLRLFAFPAQRPSVAARVPWLRGVRFLIAVDNMFDARQHIADGNGMTPFNYQPAYLDPLGRTIRVSIRKTFF